MTPVAPGYRPVLFDLDGTLADTYPGIVAAARVALESAGLPPVPAERVYPLTGKGVRALVEGLVAAVGAGGDAALCDRVEEVYARTYERTCADGATAYPGMVDLLGRLKVPLALLTNKPRRFTEKIAVRLGFARAFPVIIAGDEPGMRLKPDPWAIVEALRRLDVKGARPLLVGDTRSDALAARAAQVPCCIVRWGHGGPDAPEPAAFSVRDVGALEQLLVTGRPP